MSEESFPVVIEARLAKLERQNRRLRIGITVVVLAAAGLGVAAWRIRPWPHFAQRIIDRAVARARLEVPEAEGKAISRTDRIYHTSDFDSAPQELPATRPSKRGDYLSELTPDELLAMVESDVKMKDGRDNAIFADVVFARRVILQDANNRTRAELKLEPDGTPQLRAVSEEGNTVIPCIPLVNAKAIMLSNENGRNAAVDAEGLRFWYKSGNVAMILSCSDDQPILTMYDQAGKVWICFKLDQEGDGAQLTISDSAGQNRAVLGTAHLTNTSVGGSMTTPESALHLFDKEGKVIWKAP